MKRIKIIVSLILLAGLTGCGKDDSGKSKSPKPAKIQKLPSETELTTITLTPKAVKRLGIVTRQLTKRKARRSLSVSGEVMLPPGQSITVSSPVAGRILMPDTKLPLKSGIQVRANQTVLVLQPMLTPERDVPTPAERVAMANAKATILSLRIVADGDVKQAEARVAVAKIAYRRAEQLLADRAGSERARDEAKAQLKIAEEALKAAKERQKQLASLSLDQKHEKAKPLNLPTPKSGVLRQIMVAPGQLVASGAPLFEVIDVSKLWIRLPIYTGDLNRVDLQALVNIESLSPLKKDSVSASSIPAPPSADPLAITTDVYYLLDNASGRFRPGERVTARIPMKEEETRYEIPYSAVLYDIHGGTWVYEQIRPQVYRRRRIQVRFVEADQAVLARDPGLKGPVVVEGNAEVFGTELGIGK